MTNKLPPGSPPLTIDGKPDAKEDDTIADSAWEGQEDPAQDKQESLGKIARARKPAGGRRTQG